MPLLDEAAELLGEDDRAAHWRARLERQQQVAYAQGVLDIVSRDLEDDPEILMAYDLLNADRLAAWHEELSYLTTSERAAADRTWAFGHIVVDEAQELSEMAWRMLMRRCPSRSMTIAGDIAQSSNPASVTSWDRVLAPHLGNRWRLDRLTINYRTPAEIMAVAADVLAEIDRTSTCRCRCGRRGPPRGGRRSPSWRAGGPGRGGRPVRRPRPGTATSRCWSRGPAGRGERLPVAAVQRAGLNGHGPGRAAGTARPGRCRPGGPQAADVDPARIWTTRS